MEALQRLHNRGSISTGYNIDNSAAFGGANGIQFNPSSDGNRRTWTVSLWLKRSEISTETTIFGAQNTAMVLMDPDWFRFTLYTGSTTYYFDTENGGPVYRDTSAWYNFVFQCDTTQGTAADRAKLWVNGEAVTNTHSNVIPQNTEFQLNNNTVNFNVGYFYAGAEQLDGYLADVHFTDGVANDPTEFGEFNEDTGIWKPKAYTGSYGTNGFYLEFKESAASATGIGKDTSGNGHNFSTGGTYPSQATDTPTNNFATQNVIWGTDRMPLMSEGATEIGNNVNAYRYSPATMGVANGKWYWEIKPTVNGNTLVSGAGIASNQETLFFYQETGNFVYHYDGNKYVNGGSSSYGAAWATNDIIGFAYDADNWTLTCYVNNSSQGNLLAGQTDLSGELFIPYVYSFGTHTYQTNFGGYTTMSNTHTNTDANGYGSFVYAPPTGYYALCTKNLEEFG